MARILCLSDIHYSKKHGSLAYGEEINETLTKDMGNKLDVLYSSMEQLGGIDLFVFCGDYLLGYEDINSKDETSKEFTGFLDRLNNSEKIFNCEPKDNCNHMIIVPGNHDTSREDDEKLLERFKDNTKLFLTPFKTRNGSYPHVPIFIFDDFKLIVECVSTVNHSATKDENINSIIKKISDSNIEHKDDIIKQLKNYSVYDIPTITEDTITKFHESCRNINKEEKYSDYKRIVISHHPLLDGIENGITIKKFNSTSGGYAFMKSAVSYGYDLFVHGHLHENSCLQIKDNFLDANISFLQIGVPNFDTENEKTCAVMIDTDEEDRHESSITYFKYDSVRMEFKQSNYIKFNSKGTISKYGNDILLIDDDIKEIISENKIIKNGDVNNIEAASYDCSLGYEYKKSESKYCNWSEVKNQKIQSDGVNPGCIKLKPNETAFIYTYEEFDLPNDMIMHASPISTWLRRGIRVDISYFIDPGFKGRFGFPVVNESDEDIEINSKDPIMSIELVKLGKKCSKNWSERHPDRSKRRMELKE